MDEINFITLSTKRLEDMLTSAAHMGAINALRNAGVPTKDLFTRAEMQRMHGRGKVNRLIADNRLVARVDSSSNKKLYSELQYQSLIL